MEKDAQVKTANCVDKRFSRSDLPKNKEEGCKFNGY